MSSEELADTIAAVNAKIDAQIAQSRQLAQESARLETEASQTMATVTSADGRVTITARPTGAIESVRLQSGAAADLASLGVTITETIARAQRVAAERVLVSMEQTLGADSPLVAAVRRDVDTAFPQVGGSTIEYR
ncbi:YbaB/EbfC family nucleoid-associated protein [Microbacterium foliorum]